ncbi:MAG TPA: S8 family serine peptidase [Casimicrobiaceae bacterium]|nr:S8 family serine peptidase [Casimicrobiaceae bacterium]
MKFAHALLRCRAVLIVALLVGGFAPIHAWAATIDAIVVKFQGDEALAGVTVLPTGHRFVVVTAMRTGIIELGRTNDGAYRLELDPAMPFHEAQSAINRLRLDPHILYANLSTREPPSRERISAKRGGSDDLPLGRIIVKYRDDARDARSVVGIAVTQDKLDRIAALAGVAAAHERALFNGAALVRLFTRLPRQRVEVIAEALSRDPDVEYAEPDYRAFPKLVPNDPLYASQWHYWDPSGGVNLPAAWNRTTGSSSIRIAVLDTGSLPHPDLAGRFAGGHDFIRDYIIANDRSPAQPASCTPTLDPRFAPCISSRDSDPTDPGDWISASEDSGSDWGGWLEDCASASPGGQFSASSWHGTHVAGTIGAASNNGTGVAGINWISPIVAVRVLGKCGGYTSDIADAMVWASGGSVAGVPANAFPARVLNLSLGGLSPCSSTSQNAINSALSRGSVVVVAAGNESTDASESSPGNCNGVISVAAIGRSGQRTSYTNFDDVRGLSAPYPANTIGVDIAAPGGGDGQAVLSTLNAGTTTAGAFNYAGFNGTSMATPHVAGIASLMLSVNAALTPAQLLSAMQATARAFPSGTSRDCTSDFTRVDSAPGFPKYCGAGIIDADAAIAAVTPITQAIVTISSALNPSTLAQSVTFTATVSGNAPTGSVAFTADGVVIASCGSVALAGTGSARSAQCATTDLTTGEHSLRASYSGDANNAPAVSASLSQTVLPPGPTGGPAVAIKQRDFNGDRRGDLLWRSALGTAIWLMNGTTSNLAANVGAVPDWVATHSADFDGDGKTDLLYRSTSSGATSMWIMNGVSPITSETLLSLSEWQVTHTGDFNGDGKADLVWYNASSGTTSTWLMNGTTALSVPTLLTHPAWKVTHIGDFDGDGTSDLLWTNEATGETAIWLMRNGIGVSAAVVLSHPTWRVALIGDFNGDGRSDLAWRNDATGESAIWLMNGFGIVGNGIVLASPSWMPTHVADLNGDGRSDIIWRHTTGDTHAWLMNGLVPFAAGAINVAGASVVTTGDYDGDGKADIVWYEPSQGDTIVRLMNGLSTITATTVLRTTYWTVVP